jgi:hypothetical protein
MRQRQRVRWRELDRKRTKKKKFRNTVLFRI